MASSNAISIAAVLIRRPSNWPAALSSDCSAASTARELNNCDPATT